MDWLRNLLSFSPAKKPLTINDLPSYKANDWLAFAQDVDLVYAEKLSPEERQRGYEIAFAWGSKEILRRLIDLRERPVEHGAFAPIGAVCFIPPFQTYPWHEYVEPNMRQYAKNVLEVMTAWVNAYEGSWEEALKRLRAVMEKSSPGQWMEHEQIMIARMWEDYILQDRSPAVRAKLRAVLDRCAPLPVNIRSWLGTMESRYSKAFAAQAAQEFGDAVAAAFYAEHIAREHDVYTLCRTVLGLKSIGIVISNDAATRMFRRLMHHRLYADAAMVASAFGWKGSRDEVAREWRNWAVATGNVRQVSDGNGGTKEVESGDGSTIRCAPDPTYRVEGIDFTA